MKIAIMGAGGVGGYSGTKLALGGSDVSFIARGTHLAAIKTQGLIVRSPLVHGIDGRHAYLRAARALEGAR